MAATTPSVIALNYNGDTFIKKAVAGGVILPGHICKRNTDGKLLVQSVAGQAGPVLVALEETAVGRSIADAYSSGSEMRCMYAQPGTEIYGLVPASAPAIVIGDVLALDGTGCFVKVINFAVGASALTGTVDGTISNVAAVAITTGSGNTYTDASVNTAVNTAITSVNLQLKEVATVLQTLKTGTVVAVALEAVNNSANSVSPVRIKVEIV